MINTIIIVGCGSIGQRHAKNAKKVGIENIILCDTNLERIKEFSEEIDSSSLYESYEKAFLEHPEIDAAIISTPSGLHIKPATFFAEKKVNIFVEKPLSKDLNGVDELIETVIENGVINMMGQSYRFHEGFLELKKLIDNNILGKIYNVNYFGGHYLPDWHPEMDYRKEYTAQKRLGGGVLLTNMSHTLDTINWLFCEITQIKGWKTRISDLEIDVEDCVFCLLKTEKGIIVQLQSDFLKRKNRHQMIIFGEKGHIWADFIENTINVWILDKTPEIIKYNFHPNQRYINELLYFAVTIKERKMKHELDLSLGKKVLELIANPKIKSI